MEYKYFLLISLIIPVNAEPFDGLTLITNKSSAPFSSLLINNDYNIINEWYLDCRPASIAYIMPDSSLILPCKYAIDGNDFGAQGGIIKRLDWFGDILWEYYFNKDEYIPHHDIEPLDNGNILVITWESKTEEEAIAAGRQNVDDIISPLAILELKPLGENGTQIVWEWHIWDHLIQNVDSLVSNFGVISENPQLININIGNLNGENGDWLHTNSIHYNSNLDQIILSSRFLDEFFVIDHSTTTEEASSHFGGNSGKGGDLLFRWGNPQNYNRGNESNQMLDNQHSVNWIPNGYPGAGNIILFNNRHIPGVASSIIELVPPVVDSNGNYNLYEGEAYGPENYSWIFLLDYISSAQSGAFKLPNGNILYTTYINNKIIEININGEIQWEYDYGGDGNQIARALKYSYDYFNGIYPCSPGDLNGDGGFNVLDIVTLANCLLADNCENLGYGCAGDLNGDGGFNVLDIVILANCVLADNCEN